MRTGVSISIVFHVVMVVIAYFGLPNLRREVMMETAIMIELVSVAEITNAPQPEVKVEEKKKVEQPEPEPEPEPEPPKPVAKVVPPTPPAPAPEPAPAPAPEPEEVAIVPPPPEAKPKAKEKPKPEPKPKPVVKEKPKPKAPAALVKVKPKRKPKPKRPDAVEMALKSLAVLKQQPTPVEAPPEIKKEEKKQPQDDFIKAMSKAVNSKKDSFDQSRPLSISEIDLVRQQIAKCWNPNFGGKNVEDMNVEITIFMNRDGMVRDARINNERANSDTVWWVMAESARRAVKNPRCQPFKLPPDKYEGIRGWNRIIMNFDPKEMLGL